MSKSNRIVFSEFVGVNTAKQQVSRIEQEITDLEGQIQQLRILQATLRTYVRTVEPGWDEDARPY